MSNSLNNPTSPNALIEKPRNESGGIKNKHGSGGTALSRIRRSTLIGNHLIEKPDCSLVILKKYFSPCTLT